MHTSLKKLIDGNTRFAQGKSVHPNRSNEIRSSLLDEQKPFAAIISCSDSRVPIEIIFDVGLGDLFVIRTAGHVLSDETMGSLEYAVEDLGINFVMILGHDNCGAVKSALNAYKTKKYSKLSSNLQSLLNHIYPVFENMDTNCENALDIAVESNIKYQVEDLMKKDPYLAKKVNDKKIMIVGAKYSLDTGIVKIYE